MASARNELQAQLELVRDEMARLADEERTLTRVLSSLNGGASSSNDGTTTKGGASSGAAQSQPKTTSARKTAKSSRRGRPDASRSTRDRVEELRGLLADGPKSRNDLAAALGVSPARVHQLLAELGSSVSSQPSPEQRRGKLWTLTGGGNGASASEPTGKRGSGTPNASAARKSSGRKRTAGK